MLFEKAHGVDEDQIKLDIPKHKSVCQILQHFIAIFNKGDSKSLC